VERRFAVQESQWQRCQQKRQNASWLPANDVLILSIGGAPNEYALPAYTWHLRRTEGRAEPHFPQAAFIVLLVLVVIRLMWLHMVVRGQRSRTKLSGYKLPALADALR